MPTEELNLDIEASTVSLNGRRFPACVLVCPEAEEGESDWDRTLGTPWVYVPLESGVLVCLQSTDEGLHCALDSRTCEMVNHDTWLPISLRTHQRTIVPGSQWWDGCEEGWLVEHIDRISTFSYSQPEGPLAELRRLKDEPRSSYTPYG